MGGLGLFCPVRLVPGWEWILEKVLEKFWNLARQNPCEPCVLHPCLCHICTCCKVKLLHMGLIFSASLEHCHSGDWQAHHQQYQTSNDDQQPEQLLAQDTYFGEFSPHQLSLSRTDAVQVPNWAEQSSLSCKSFCLVVHFIIIVYFVTYSLVGCYCLHWQRCKGLSSSACRNYDLKLYRKSPK